MASTIGSSPFLLETSALFDTRRGKRSLRFPLRVCGINRSNFEHSEGLGLGCRKGKLWGSNKHIKAIASESFGTSEDNDGSEGMLQDTIEKSKKVLALQRGLLQEVLIS